MLQVHDNVRHNGSDWFGVIEVIDGDDVTVDLEEHAGTITVHENTLTLQCPFCPNAEVDSDHRACPSCREII